MRGSSLLDFTSKSNSLSTRAGLMAYSILSIDLYSMNCEYIKQNWWGQHFTITFLVELVESFDFWVIHASATWLWKLGHFFLSSLLWHYHGWWYNLNIQLTYSFRIKSKHLNNLQYFEHLVECLIHCYVGFCVMWENNVSLHWFSLFGNV